MPTVLRVKVQATQVWFTADMICVRLDDGREVSVPLVWYPRLAKATKPQLANWELIAGGTGIHWEEIDEDILVEALVLGLRSNESASFSKKYPLNQKDSLTANEPEA
jgi:hypothetical protein